MASGRSSAATATGSAGGTSTVMASPARTRWPGLATTAPLRRICAPSIRRWTWARDSSERVAAISASMRSPAPAGSTVSWCVTRREATGSSSSSLASSVVSSGSAIARASRALGVDVARDHAGDQVGQRGVERDGDGQEAGEPARAEECRDRAEDELDLGAAAGQRVAGPQRTAVPLREGVAAAGAQRRGGLDDDGEPPRAEYGDDELREVRRHRASIPGCASLALDAVLAQLLPQGGAVDAEQRGGLGPLALAQLEDAQDVGALEVVERRDVVGGEGLERGWRGGGAARGDVGDVEHVAGGEDDGALDRVLELAHVAGPGLRDEVGDRGLGELEPAALGAQRGILGEVARERRDV